MSVPPEQQPLLAPPLVGEVYQNKDPGIAAPTKHTEVLLDFEPGDAGNPREWKKSFKWGIVALLASMAFTVTFTCIGVVPVAGRIVSDLDPGTPSSSSTSALLVTIWELGEAAGPLLIAPLSEVFGRYPVMNGCSIAFILATLLAASSQSTKVFIAARMLTGLAVASNVLNPAIIGDMFDSDERGSAMSLVMLAPLIGGAVGPAISGAIAQTLGWRAVLLIAAALAVCCELLFLICFRETYKMSILRRRVLTLRRESGEFESAREGQQEGEHEDVIKLWHSITRPVSVLFGSGVILLLALFGSVAFSYFYVMSVSLPHVLLEIYGCTPAQTGSAFMSFSVGSFCSILLCNYGLDRIYIKLRNSSNGKGKPEYRLPIAIVGAILLPFSVTAYGWTAQKHLPIPLLLLSVALLGFSLLLTAVPLSAYVVDASGIYSASALTGVIVIRCLAGTFLPLTVGPLTEEFGYGLGLSCLGALSLSMAVIPVLVFRYGEKWRQRSEFTRDT